MGVLRRIYRLARPWDGTSWSTVMAFASLSGEGHVAHRFAYRDNTLCGLIGVNQHAHTVAPRKGDQRCAVCQKAKVERV